MARHSDSQIDRDGFAVIDGVFDAGEIESLLIALESASLARSRAGARHAMQDSTVASLARDSRLLQIVRGVLGPSAAPFRATLFDKSAISNWLVGWHQDTALPLRTKKEVSGWGSWSTKAGVIYAHAPAAALERVLALRIHFDDSTASNGPLRVIPGSHRSGLLSDESAQRLAQEKASVACLASRGGVVAMRPLLIHASSKSSDAARRRVLHIEYAASMDAGDGLELAIS